MIGDFEAAYQDPQQMPFSQAMYPTSGYPLPYQQQHPYPLYNVGSGHPQKVMPMSRQSQQSNTMTVKENEPHERQRASKPQQRRNSLSLCSISDRMS